jgi:SAM-dependent methyltransferase
MSGSPSVIEEQMRSLIDPVAANYLRRHTREDGVTVDVGCGPAQYRHVISGGYLGVDVTIGEFNSKLYPGLLTSPDVLAEARSLPFRSGSFTTAFYAGICYYLNTQQLHEAMTEAYRVLKREGTLVIMDHSKKTDELLQRQYEQVWTKTANPRSCSGWLALLADAGFTKLDLSFKSYGHEKLRLSLLKRLLPRSLYFAWIDRRQAYVMITGEK